jgi:hypothetical protein
VCQSRAFALTLLYLDSPFTRLRHVIGASGLLLIGFAELDECNDWELAELLSQFEAFNNVVQQPDQVTGSQSSSSAVAIDQLFGTTDRLLDSLLPELSLPPSVTDSLSLQASFSAYRYVYPCPVAYR